jgi:hypothetical protein
MGVTFLQEALFCGENFCNTQREARQYFAAVQLLFVINHLIRLLGRACVDGDAAARREAGCGMVGVVLILKSYTGAWTPAI